jgi:hypothetical protein
VFQLVLPLNECADPAATAPLHSVAEPLHSVADSATGGAAPTTTS